MVRRTPTGTTTFVEFIELIPEDQKADLLEGVIYVASPESSEHNKLLRWLTLVLGPFIEERQLGRLTINKVAYRLSDHSAPEPDVGFVGADRVDRIKPGYVDGPPELAVEIVSPDSIDRDQPPPLTRGDKGVDPLERVRRPRARLQKPCP